MNKKIRRASSLVTSGVGGEIPSGWQFSTGSHSQAIARYKEYSIKVGKEFVTNYWKVTFFDSFSFSNYSLCEITVEDGGLIKQRRLPDMLTNLPDRIHLNGRSVTNVFLLLVFGKFFHHSSTQDPLGRELISRLCLLYSVMTL